MKAHRKVSWVVVTALTQLQLVAGCEPLERFRRDVCAANLRLAVLRVAESDPIHISTTVDYGVARRELREQVGECSLSPVRVEFLDGSSIPTAKLLILAGLQEEAITEFRRPDSLSETEEADVLFCRCSICRYRDAYHTDKRWFGSTPKGCRSKFSHGRRDCVPRTCYRKLATSPGDWAQPIGRKFGRSVGT